MNTNKTNTTITDSQIEALSAEATEAGDDAMVDLCNAAIRGDRNARYLCEEVIEEARNMTDDE